MNGVKRVDFTITRAEVWPWVVAIARALWRGGVRVKLRLDLENQTFIMDPDEDKP